MLWEVLLSLFFLLVIALLFLPIELYIDSASNCYYVQLKGLAKASFEGDEKEVIRIKLRVAFFNFYFYPLKSNRPKKKEKHPSVKKKKSKRRLGARKIVRLLRSFKVKQLLLDIDTGDNVLNAKLYPFFFFLNFTKGAFAINFEGRNQLLLVIRNRPIHIIKSFINF